MKLVLFDYLKTCIFMRNDIINVMMILTTSKAFRSRIQDVCTKIYLPAFILAKQAKWCLLDH